MKTVNGHDSSIPGTETNGLPLIVLIVSGIVFTARSLIASKILSNEIAD
jgi:hypothetical protein